jgi:predicted transglutaminase-like cysteine proteinase
MAPEIGSSILYRGDCVMAGRGFARAWFLTVPFLLLVMATCANGRPLADSHLTVPIEETSPALAPFQHVRFCLRYPDDCKSDPSEIIAIELSAEVSELLSRVNRDVNSAIIPMQKSDGIDINDRWTIAPAAGDCNDYAVTKRHQLLSSGLPSRALRLAVVRTPAGIGHLVLVVATTKGNFVLDNLVETIRPWQTTKYQWLKIQSANDARYWYEVRPPAMALSQTDQKLRVADRR